MMNYRLQQKLKELLEKYPDPRKDNYLEIEQKKIAEKCPFTFGLISDNKDPDCLGRVRVYLPLIGPGAVSNWWQILGVDSKDKNGWWALPDLGTQVIVGFPDRNFSRGIVLGCIYDMKHLPPEHTTDNPSNSVLYQSKNHRLEIIDEDGKEEIRIESAEGKMRAILNKNGIELVNELDGGIEIKCKDLNIKGKNINLNAEKSFSITTDDAATIKEKGKFTLTSDKEIKLKGKNIKLSGSKGVTTEGKQIATKDDKVMGMDTHIMVIPAGMSTATTPLPHPFIGKINDKVSDDVKIKDKGVAVKGSKAKHDDSMHMQLPGTIKFQNNPKKEGEVTGGTGTKVKVNGKEVAVIGSQVTTCNDMGMRNNSTIIAVGASIPMPVIINPKNTEEFERKLESEEKEPKFSSVKWGATSVEEGEETELTASVQDIADGNMVTMLVFPEGKGPEVGGEIASFPCTVKSGSVSAKWSYKPRYAADELPPDSDPKFVFSAHCAWCNFEKSSNSLEVKLVRPEIKNVEWQDKDGNSTSKGLVGEVLKLHAETNDVEGGITFHIYDDKGHEVDSIGAKIEGDKAEAEWTYHYNGEKLDAKPKFKIEATGNRCKACESGDVEISAKISLYLNSNIDYEVNGFDVFLIKNNEEDSVEKITLEDGKYEKEDIIPGKYEVIYEINSDKKFEVSSEQFTVQDNVKICSYNKIFLKPIVLNLEKRNFVVISDDNKDTSD